MDVDAPEWTEAVFAREVDGGLITVGEVAALFPANTGGYTATVVTIGGKGGFAEQAFYMCVRVDDAIVGAKANGDLLPPSWEVLFRGNHPVLLPAYVCREHAMAGDTAGQYYVRGWYLAQCLEGKYNFPGESEGWRQHARAVFGPGLKRKLDLWGCTTTADIAALGWNETAAAELAVAMRHLVL